MIAALEPKDYASILPLYQDLESVFPLIGAVIQNQQRGQVFVDQPGSPASAVVITGFGFMSFLGTDQNEDFNSGLASLLADTTRIKPAYLLWYAPPAAWRQRLDALLPEPVRCRERARFEFRAELADFIHHGSRSPHGFELKRINEELLPKSEELGTNISSRFWSSGADFLKHGLGVGLVKDGKIVSMCYAACVDGGLAEIDIVTAPEYRGSGLGTLVARQFIKECLHDGVTPTWDCFTGNLASYKLAERLGFVSVRTYPFYNFNIPLKVDIPAVSQ